MKKLFCVVFLMSFLLMAIPCASSAMTEEEGYQYIHDLFANHTDQDLQNLLVAISYEIEYRQQTKASVPSDDLSDEETQSLIVDFFESRGYKIKRVMFQPLVEKDPGGLYGGEERWFITLESGTQIGAWVSDGCITYCIGNRWYNDVPLL